MKSIPSLLLFPLVMMAEHEGVVVKVAIYLLEDMIQGEANPMVAKNLRNLEALPD